MNPKSCVSLKDGRSQDDYYLLKVVGSPKTWALRVVDAVDLCLDLDT